MVNKEDNIRNDLRVLMFQQLLANKPHEFASFKVWPKEVWVWSPTKRRKKKTRVKHEPRSVHGRAVKKKPKAEQETAQPTAARFNELVTLRKFRPISRYLSRL